MKKSNYATQTQVDSGALKPGHAKRAGRERGTVGTSRQERGGGAEEGWHSGIPPASLASLGKARAGGHTTQQRAKGPHPELELLHITGCAAAVLFNCKPQRKPRREATLFISALGLLVFGGSLARARFLSRTGMSQRSADCAARRFEMTHSPSPWLPRSSTRAADIGVVVQPGVQPAGVDRPTESHGCAGGRGRDEAVWAKKGQRVHWPHGAQEKQTRRGLQCSGREEQQCRAGEGRDEGAWNEAAIERGGRGERERERLNPATLSAKRNKRADGSSPPTDASRNSRS